MAKGVLDDKVEVAEESVTNISISKSSEHSKVVPKFGQKRGQKIGHFFGLFRQQADLTSGQNIPKQKTQL